MEEYRQLCKYPEGWVWLNKKGKIQFDEACPLTKERRKALKL